MAKGKREEEWCESEEVIFTDNPDKKYRCSICGRRLNLKIDDNTYPHYKIPPHKIKGYKIKRKKQLTFKKDGDKIRHTKDIL